MEASLIMGVKIRKWTLYQCVIYPDEEGDDRN
jgi:hypothetical protein